MSVERELLARICAEPSNEEVRLVYADRLLERGDARGTFIAQQCELARLEVFDARYAPLLASSSIRSSSGAFSIASPCRRSPWRPIGSGCARMETLLELHANGCSLSDAAVGVLVKSKLDRLVTLDLSSNKLTDEGFEQLAGWQGLEHITHLRVGNNRKVTAKGYQALMAAEQFVPVVLDIGKSSDAKLVKQLRERFADALMVS